MGLSRRFNVTSHTKTVTGKRSLSVLDLLQRNAKLLAGSAV